MSASQRDILRLLESMGRGSDTVILKFGAGVHSRASEEDINELEASDAENGLLNIGNQELKPRPPFDLIGTLPNGGEVRGGGTLIKSDNTVSTLIQGADKVYEWDGATTFTEVGTVSSNAKLRGKLEQNWQLDDKLILTDLNLQDSVKEWDGTTFKDVAFTDENGASFGTFKARYCYVSKERAIFANVESNATPTPHLIVGSKRGDYQQITVANRPSSSLSAADPWFLVQPDNQYINGIVEGLGQTVISSQFGSMYKLVGVDATDFDISTLVQRAGVVGDEAIALSSNDIVFGRQGRLESAIDTEASGDVETNDLSFWIQDQIEAFRDWLIVSNRRLNRTYFHPVGKSEVWVLHHALLQTGLSPWMKYTTSHPMGFNPTMMMSLLDPSDKLEYVFMGDSSGNLYRMEGTGSGDGGTTAVNAFRVSKLLSAATGKIFDLTGDIRYRKNNAISVTLRFEFSGEHTFKEAVTITVPAADFDPVYGTTAYYGTTEYYGTDVSTLVRQRFAAAGGGTDVQLRITVNDTDDWTINTVRLHVKETPRS